MRGEIESGAVSLWSTKRAHEVAGLAPSPPVAQHASRFEGASRQNFLQERAAIGGTHREEWSGIEKVRFDRTGTVPLGDQFGVLGVVPGTWGSEAHPDSRIHDELEPKVRVLGVSNSGCGAKASPPFKHGAPYHRIPWGHEGNKRDDDFRRGRGANDEGAVLQPTSPPHHLG